VLQVVNRKPLIDGLSEQGLKPKERLKGNIEICDVYFSYPSRPTIQVCKGYSLSISAGETVALVGTSGSGKSTLVNLLLRFYDVQRGSISFDGVNIKDINCRWLRSNVGFVGQEPVLFFGSIFDNIAYGLNSISADGDYSREQLTEHVVAAAKLANAHDFIMSCPQGYETDVGSNGAAMSGGQKQRIAIARALIKKPAVLLLDEATSALDNTSERMVQESIDILQRSKAQTTIVIAHRLSTVRNADKIAVVLEGRIAELGTHDELLKNKSGMYADLVHLQMDGTEEPPSTTKCGELFSPATEIENAVELYANKVVPDADIESAILPSEKGREADNKEKTKEIDKRISRLVWKHPRWLLVTIIGGNLQNVNVSYYSISQT
jgi:ATP-binding cassette, subfamily B (MDR/TAP), member 1